MHYVKKSYPGPECLDAEKLKSSGNYRCKGVLNHLKNDSYDKCYICEQKGLTAINIEHFRPHMQDIDLKFDWSNLMYACSHCNNIKLAKYQLILNCTDAKLNINKKLKHRIGFMPMEVVKIEAIGEDLETLETRDLLNAVYNGTPTDIKSIEAANLREQILDAVNEFNRLLRQWFKEPDGSDFKEYLNLNIRSNLQNHSEFVSFKRSLILDSDYFRTIFKDAFE